MKTINFAQPQAGSGLWLVLLSAVMWGTVGVTTKTIYGLAATTPSSIGFFRLAMAVPVLLLICWLNLGQQMFRVTRRDLGLMILIGVVTALYQLLFFAAIERVGAAVATLITLCTAPVMVAIMSAGLSRERLTPRILAALGCALAGTAMLIEIQPGSTGQNNFINGVLLALGSAFGYAVIALCSRALAGRYHPFQPIAIGFSVGAVVLLLFTVKTGFVIDYPLAGWALLLYLGLIPTALAYSLFLAGIRYVTATVASIITLIEPLTSAVLAWLIFDERFSSLGLLGALLLFVAIALLYRGEAGS
jgi:DME family drug/metabolite transporter